MIELLMALAIIVTFFIDGLSLIIKGAEIERRLAGAYVVSQALSYITRLSLFFILPIIGLILDGVVGFDLYVFLSVFVSLLLLIIFIFITFYERLRSNAKYLIYYFNSNLSKFAYFLIFRAFSGAKKIRIKNGAIDILYSVSHLFIYLTFPVVLFVGINNIEYRGVLLGSISAYTGVFSIYILFFVERKIPGLRLRDRVNYVGKLMLSKLLGMIGAVFVLIISFFYLIYS